MKKEILDKIEEFIEDLPLLSNYPFRQGSRENWTNFGGGWYDFVVYDFVVAEKKKFRDKLTILIEEIIEPWEKELKVKKIEIYEKENKT